MDGAEVFIIWTLSEKCYFFNMLILWLIIVYTGSRRVLWILIGW
jgi:hypothetical protein